jgi:glycosyltransferase involved in cell wall biosynthesis
MPEPTSVLIPALNEERSIAKVLQEIPAGSCHQIIVIDNGSNDRTGEIARRCGAQVVNEPRKGYGFACLAGLNHLRHGTHIVAFLDGDHSDYPEELSRLTHPIYQQQADLVIGSRILRAQNLSHLKAHQLWGNRLILALLYSLYGCRFSDLGPFRAIRLQSLEKLAMTDRTWGWNVEMQIKAVRAGLRIQEIPVSYRDRIGYSKISGSVRGSIAAGFRILYTVFRYSL